MAIIKAMYTPIKKESPIKPYLDQVAKKEFEKYKLILREKELKPKAK